MPVGRMLSKFPDLIDAKAVFDDGRFSVWSAKRDAGRKNIHDHAEANGTASRSVVAEHKSLRTHQCATDSTRQSIAGQEEDQNGKARRLREAKKGIRAQAATLPYNKATSVAERTSVEHAQPVRKTVTSERATPTLAKRACDWSMSKAQRKRARRKEQTRCR